MTNKASGWDDASSARIASGQAFFVEGLSGQTSVTFTESHKTNAAIPNNNYFRTMPDWASRIMISLKDAQMEHIDETLIRFSDGFGTADSVNMYDGISFNSGTFIAGRKQNTRLAIQTRPVSVDSDTVRLSVSIVQPGNYQLDFSEHTHLGEDFKIMLIDRYVNQIRRIDFDSVYSFQVTTDPASQGDDRFALVLRRHAREALKYLGIDALRKNDDVQVQWEVTSEDNLSDYVIERSSDGKQFEPIDTLPAMGRMTYQTRDLMAPTSALWYRIVTMGKPSHIPQRSATVRINAVGSGGKLNLYPNPAGSELNIYYANAPQGVYSLRILDMQGRVLMQQEGVRFQTKTITLQIGRLLAGKYLLEVTGSDGNRAIENFIHK
jgi:hypothetical protein